MGEPAAAEFFAAHAGAEHRHAAMRNGRKSNGIPRQTRDAEHSDTHNLLNRDIRRIDEQRGCSSVRPVIPAYVSGSPRPEGSLPAARAGASAPASLPRTFSDKENHHD